MAGAMPTISRLKRRSGTIFQENASFDQHSRIYPRAATFSGETRFHAKDVTAYMSP
jgi:hypothetical protein